MNKPFSCEIRPLELHEASELSGLLLASSENYIGHFHPFAFDAATLREQIAHAKRDQFWAVRRERELAGFFMLRGFDEGYARPAFGVFIAEKFSGRGLATRALEHALGWCREQEIAEVMLKVHPQNESARHVYERAGFERVEMCANSGQLILVKRLC